MSKSKQLLLVCLLVFLAAMSRLAKHPFNFTPIIAMAIFTGFYTKSKYFFLIPLLAMLISDYFIGFYNFWLMLSVYVGIIIAFFIAHTAKNNKKWYIIVGISVSSSLMFFLLTNFSVWCFTEWYPHTLIGLRECFIMAIPFFRNSLVGDLFYSFVFFGIYELVFIVVNNIFNKTKLRSAKI